MVNNRVVKPMIHGLRYCSPLHLLFEYNILIFAKGEIKGIKKIIEFLERYVKLSGQVVNRKKTKIFFGVMSYAKKVAIRDEFGIAVVELLVKYRGVKLIAGRVSRQAISDVVDVIT